MKDKKIIEKIKEKFERIFKRKGPKPRDPEILNKIYEEIKNSKKAIKISDISNNTGIKKNTISRYIKKYLEPQIYVRKNKVYTPPFLMVISHEAEKTQKQNRNSFMDKRIKKKE
jgi:Fic family protein